MRRGWLIKQNLAESTILHELECPADTIKLQMAHVTIINPLELGQDPVQIATLDYLGDAREL